MYTNSPWHLSPREDRNLFQGKKENGAGDESRTRDLNLGKVALYQLSYSRIRLEARIAFYTLGRPCQGNFLEKFLLDIPP